MAMDESWKFRGKIEDDDVTFPVENGGRGVLKEKNRYENDDDVIATPLFLSGTIKQQPFAREASTVVARKQYHENYEPWTTAPNNLSKSELPPKIHEQIQLELEAAILKVMAFEGYEVSEEMMAELNRTFEEQKDRQERFKHHLRSSWQRPCAGGSFVCYASQPTFYYN